MMICIDENKYKNQPGRLREWVEVIDFHEFNSFVESVKENNPNSDVVSEYTVIDSSTKLDAIGIGYEIPPDVFLTTPNPNMRIDYKVDGGSYQTSVHCFGTKRIEESLNLHFPAGGSIPIGYVEMFFVPDEDGLVHRCRAMLMLTSDLFRESGLYVKVGAMCLPDYDDLNTFIEQWKYSAVPISLDSLNNLSVNMDQWQFARRDENLAAIKKHADSKEEMELKYSFELRHWKDIIDMCLRYWAKVQYVIEYVKTQFMVTQVRTHGEEPKEFPKELPLFRPMWQESMSPKVYGPRRIDLTDTINDIAKHYETAPRNHPRPHWRSGTWVTRNGKTFWREGGWVNVDYWGYIPEPREVKLPEAQQ
jgi:hypothetical protein